MDPRQHGRPIAQGSPSYFTSAYHTMDTETTYNPYTEYAVQAPTYPPANTPMTARSTQTATAADRRLAAQVSFDVHDPSSASLYHTSLANVSTGRHHTKFQDPNAQCLSTAYYNQQLAGPSQPAHYDPLLTSYGHHQQQRQGATTAVNGVQGNISTGQPYDRPIQVSSTEAMQSPVPRRERRDSVITLSALVKETHRIMRGKMRGRQEPHLPAHDSPTIPSAGSSNQAVAGPDMLGIGTFGTVAKCWDTRLKEFVAVKTSRPADEWGRWTLDREIRFLSSFAACHKNVIHAFRLHSQRPDTLVTEFCNGGDLQAYAGNQCTAGRRFPEELIWKLCEQMAAGVAWVHSQRIIHSDIKPENFLLDFLPCWKVRLDHMPAVYPTIKLADFGLSAIAYRENTHNDHPTLICLGKPTGTNEYLAPEQLPATQLEAGYPNAIPRERTLNTRATDVWALGATIVCLTTLQVSVDEIVNFQNPMRVRWNLRTGKAETLASYQSWDLDTFPPDLATARAQPPYLLLSDPDRTWMELMRKMGVADARPYSSSLAELVAEALTWDPKSRITAEDLRRKLYTWNQTLGLGDIRVPEWACLCTEKPPGWNQGGLSDSSFRALGLLPDAFDCP